MRKATALLLAAIAFAPAIAIGGENSLRLTEKHEKCGEFSSYSKLEGCFYQVYQESDNYLNQEYNSLVRYLSELENKKHKKRLINCQNNWIKYRDLDCEFYSDGQPIRFNKCLSARTIQRLKEYGRLQHFLCDGLQWLSLVTCITGT